MLAEAATLLSPFSMQLLVKIICICCMLCNSTSTAQKWSIKMEPEKINITTSDEVTINCRVDYPPPQKDKTNIQGFWKALKKGLLNINSKDKNKFISHPNNSFVMQKFQNKTKLIGNISTGNCSLHMKGITESGQYYFRIETGSDEYSFKEHLFTIVGDSLPDVELGTENNEETPVEPSPKPEESTSLAVVLVSICVPVVLIFLASVVVVVAVFLLKRRNREVNLVRQTSDYYVNFQIPQTLQSTSSETKENIYKKQEPPLAPKEEPIYSNVQSGPCVEPSVESDPKDNIYCNVDYGRQL